MSDPYEFKDLSSEKEHAALMKKLRTEVFNWWKESGGGELSFED